MTQDRSLADRWSQMSIAEQLGNVGSEVDRAIRAWKSGNAQRFDSAVDRALAQFDLTAGDERWRGHRRREILRSRSEFCALFWDDTYSERNADGLSRYFLQFAKLARRTR